MIGLALGFIFAHTLFTLFGVTTSEQAVNNLLWQLSGMVALWYSMERKNEN